jgi:hypothetical protein
LSSFGSPVATFNLLLKLAKKTVELALNIITAPMINLPISGHIDRFGSGITCWRRA